MNASDQEIEKSVELLTVFLRGMSELTVSKKPQFEIDRLSAKEFENTSAYILESFRSFIRQTVNIPEKAIKFTTINSRQWAEVVPLFCGGYSTAFTSDEDGQPFPYLYDSESEARIEQESIVQDYIEQIKSGEREEGDFWEGEIYECELDGDELRLFDDDVCFHVMHWKDAL